MKSRWPPPPVCETFSQNRFFLKDGFPKYNVKIYMLHGQVYMCSRYIDQLHCLARETLSSRLLAHFGTTSLGQVCYKNFGTSSMRKTLAQHLWYKNFGTSSIRKLWHNIFGTKTLAQHLWDKFGTKTVEHLWYKSFGTATVSKYFKNQFDTTT